MRARGESGRRLICPTIWNRQIQQFDIVKFKILPKFLRIKKLSKLSQNTANLWSKSDQSVEILATFNTVKNLSRFVGKICMILPQCLGNYSARALLRIFLARAPSSQSRVLEKHILGIKILEKSVTVPRKSQMIT